jgi:catechol 2,3-dioxygenase-like lactoylglutathione lyase family enzyme
LTLGIANLSASKQDDSTGFARDYRVPFGYGENRRNRGSLTAYSNIEYLPPMKRAFSVFFLLTVFTTSAIAAPDEFASPTIGVGVVVSDLDKALDFYTNVIGMIQTGSFDIKEDFSKTSGLANGAPTQVRVLRLGNGEEATQWKLMSFGKAQPQKDDFINDRNGMRYVTILVKDLTPFLKRIKDRRIKLLGETPVALGPNNNFVLIQDPDGTFIELIGPMK